MGSLCSVSRSNDDLAGIEGVYYNENRSRVIYRSLNLEVKQWGQSVRRSYDLQLSAKIITPDQLSKAKLCRVPTTSIIIVDIHVKNITPSKFCSKRDLIRGDFRQPTINWGKFKVYKSVPEFLPMAMCVGQYRVYAILHHDSPNESKIRVNGKLFHDEVTLETLCENDNNSSPVEEMEEMINFLENNCKFRLRTETADYSFDSGFRGSRSNSLFAGFVNNKISDGRLPIRKKSKKISSTGYNADGLSTVVEGSNSSLSSRSATEKAKMSSSSDMDDVSLPKFQNQPEIFMSSSQDEWLSRADFECSRDALMSIENIPNAHGKSNVHVLDSLTECISEYNADIRSPQMKHKCHTTNPMEQAENITGQCQNNTHTSSGSGKRLTDRNCQQKSARVTQERRRDRNIRGPMKTDVHVTSTSYKDKKSKS